VRPRGVVVAQVLGQHMVQLTFVVDKRAVQALRTYRRYSPIGESAHFRRPWRDLHDLDAGAGEHRIEHGGELGVLVRDKGSDALADGKIEET
jgi:hypothetical protein